MVKVKHRIKKVGPFVVAPSSDQAHYTFWCVYRDGKRLTRNYAYRYQAVAIAQGMFNKLNCEGVTP